jgi:hypothetical protein
MENEKLEYTIEKLLSEIVRVNLKFRKEDPFEMLTWAFLMGNHQAELKEIEKKIAYYIDQQPPNRYPETTFDRQLHYVINKEEFEHIFHRIQFIADTMKP